MVRVYKGKAGGPVKFFVTFGPTQVALPFCADPLVAAREETFDHPDSNFKN
jgi:hypothetical protein